jgi:NAD(P)-dependent dehydrogenase (short-subunit alcohol dehydrogenase family)
MRRAGRGTFLATGGHPSVAPEPRYATLSLGKAGLRAAVSLLHDELAPHGVHVAGITIGGPIALGGALDPARLAEIYWALHTQPEGEWTAETSVDDRSEAAAVRTLGPGSRRLTGGLSPVDTAVEGTHPSAGGGRITRT